MPPPAILYFGPDTTYAISPHNVDNKNAAIQISPAIHTATGDINIYVYLSNVNNVQVPGATVRLFWGPAGVPPRINPPKTWVDQAHLLTEWNPEAFGTEPVPPDPPIPNAKVLNCCWAGMYVWHTNNFPAIHTKPFCLLATLDCDDPSEHPSQDVLSQDSCAAVLNSMLL